MKENFVAESKYINKNDYHVFFFLDFVWERKWFYFSCIVVSIVSGFIVFLTYPSPRNITQSNFQVYASGSPSFSFTEIVDQISVVLSNAGIESTYVGTMDGRPTVSIGQQDADEVLGKIDELEEGIVAQARVGLALLTTNVDRENTSIPELLRYRAFLDGYESGAIDLIRASNHTVVPSSYRSRIGVLTAIFVLGLGVLLSIFASLLKQWLAYRSRTASARS